MCCCVPRSDRASRSSWLPFKRYSIILCIDTLAFFLKPSFYTPITITIYLVGGFLKFTSTNFLSWTNHLLECNLVYLQLASVMSISQSAHPLISLSTHYSSSSLLDKMNDVLEKYSLRMSMRKLRFSYQEACKDYQFFKYLKHTLW